MNNDLLLRCLEYTLIAYLLRWGMGFLSQQAFKPAQRNAGEWAMLPPRSLYWLSYGGILFWLTLIVFADFSRGKPKMSGYLSAFSGFFWECLECWFIIANEEPYTGRIKASPGRIRGGNACIWIGGKSPAVNISPEGAPFW